MRYALCVPNRMCAQRLSASKDKSQLRLSLSLGVHLVLNAFRHQRINHDATRHSILRSSGAQRLSASKDKSPCKTESLSPQIKCAQRLSASKDKSLSTFPGRVLISFECSTPFGIKG